LTPGVNFINILQKAFICADPKRAKNTVNPSVFFALLGSLQAKAFRKMLMKLTPGVNFINILPTAFLTIFFCQKITKLNSY